MKLQDLTEQKRVIEGDVRISRYTKTLKGLEINGILLKGAIVKGDVFFYKSHLTSLEGGPSEVGGDFDCSNTKITSLKGSPSRVDGSFDCNDTRILSLKGAPASLGGYMNCSSTDITWLIGAPSEVVDFYCINTKIRSFEGAPKYIKGLLNCNNSPLASLHNIHKHIKYIGGTFFIANAVRSHVLGIMLIKGVDHIEFHVGNDQQGHAAWIINKHLKGDRDVHACQEEMLEAGLGEYAKL